MKRALAGLALAALFAAPAFAQTAQTAPAPDVGVDYSQPYLNDLLLRVTPPDRGTLTLMNGRPISICDDEIRASQAAPDDEAVRQALAACWDKQTAMRAARKEQIRPEPGAGPTPPLYTPKPGAPSGLRPLPPVSSHSNARN